MSTMTTRPLHPFHGAIKRPPTRRHTPVIWECMLGTVYARSPQGEVRYFDYDWPAARTWAQVDQASDLRVARAAQSPAWKGYRLPGNLSQRQLALWAVRPPTPAPA